MEDLTLSSRSSEHAVHGFLQRRYARDSDFVFRQIADEIILLPIRKNLGDLESIYTLNEVAARVWELLDGRRTLEEVRNLIVAEFEVTPEVVEADLEEFLRHLEEIGAVVVA